MTLRNPVRTYISAFWAGVLNKSTAATARTALGLTTPITHENGGLEADVSAYDGIPRITSGATTALPYSVGTWTPTLGVLSGTDGTHTYSTQSGLYLRIGDLVYVSAVVILTAKDVSMSGSLAIKTLPFTAMSGSGGPGNQSILNIAQAGAINLSAGYSMITARASPNSTLILIEENGDDVAPQALTAAAIGNSSRISCSGIYRAV